MNILRTLKISLPEILSSLPVCISCENCLQSISFNLCLFPSQFHSKNYSLLFGKGFLLNILLKHLKNEVGVRRLQSRSCPIVYPLYICIHRDEIHNKVLSFVNIFQLYIHTLYRRLPKASKLSRNLS